MPNGIDLILADHRMVDALFSSFASTSDGTLIGQIVDALTAHDAAEQAALYPVAAEVLADGPLLVRSAEAHSAVKRQIAHLVDLEGPPLVDAVARLQELVEAHVADEEKHLLPALAEAATAQQLDSLGARILQAKQRGG